MLSREMDPGLGRSGRTKPRLEALEDRTCPSGIGLQGHTLVFTGDAAASVVKILDAGNGHVTATLTDSHGHQTTLHASGVTEIEILSKTGSDHIDYALTGALTASEQLVFHLGKGDDRVHLDFSKGVSASGLGINIDGQGNDAVSAVFGAVHNTNLAFHDNMGGDYGQARVAFNGDLTGVARALVDVQGGHAIEGVDVWMHGNIAKTASLTVQTNGGLDDTVHINYSGQLLGQLNVNVQGGAGSDWLESNINLIPNSTGKLSVKELGGLGDDLLILRVNNHGSHLNSLFALADGGGGYNVGEVTSNVTVHNLHL